MPCVCCPDDDDLPPPTTRVWRSDVPEAPPKRHRTRSRRRPIDSVRRTMRDFATPRLQWGPSQPARRTKAIITHGDIGQDAMTASKSRERIAKLQGGHNGP